MQPHDLVMYVAKQIMLCSILVITLKKGSYQIATIVAIILKVSWLYKLDIITALVLLNIILY